MPFPISVLALAAVFTLALFLSVLNFSFWRARRDDRTPLWLAGWLAASVIFSFCRLLQYAPLSGQMYVLISRILLTAAFGLAWIGYELGNTFAGNHPPRRERAIIVILVAAPILLLWGSDLVLTDQVVLRKVAFGGEFHGVRAGILYLPASLLILAVSAIPPIRLLRSSRPLKQQHIWMAMGYIAVILFGMVDFLAVSFNLAWLRLSDFSYLPIAIFFDIMQVQHYGRFYREMDATVRDGTAKLGEANELLHAEIAKHRRAEDALQSSGERYRMLFDSNPQPAWVYDLETLAFLVVNDAAITRYGYSREEFLHMTIENIRPADELTALHKNLAQERHTLEWSGPWKHRKKDGTIISVEILSHELSLDGRPARLVMANDITERLRAETALQESEEKYRTVVEKAKDGITIIQNGKVRYVNLQLAEMRGESIATIIGERFDSFVHPEERQKIIERYQRRLAGDHEPTTYETVLVRKDNSSVQVELTTGMITYQGAPAEIVIVRDISERKLSDQALQRQLREMIVLNTVATAGAKATSVNELIEDVTRAVGEMLYPDNCGVLLADHEAASWKAHPSYHGTSPERLEGTHALSEGIAGKVIASGKTLRVDDVGLEPAYEQFTQGIQSELAVPILVNGTIFGCLNAESKALSAFTEHDERLMRTIAESMSTAIEKIRLLQLEKRRREEAEILYRTTRDLVIERDLSKLLHIIVERAAAMLGASSGGLDLCEPEHRLVRCAVSYNTLHDYTGETLKYGEGAGGVVAETGQPLIIEDYRTWDRRASVYEGDQPFISMLSIPMRWQERVIGVIHIHESTRVRLFSEEDLRRATLFANQAAIAVENARLFKETSQRAQEAAAIAEVGRDISQTLQLDVILERIAAYAKVLLKARTCAVYLPEAATPTLRAIAALGPSADEIKHDPLNLGEGILGNIALRKSGEIINNVAADPRAIHIQGTELLRLEHLMGVPVLSKDQLTGLIAVWRIGEGYEFNSTELTFLGSLAGQVAVAIENARLFEAEQRRYQEAEALRKATSVIASTLSLEKVLSTILASLKEVVPYDSASMLLMEGEDVRLAAANGLPDPEVESNRRFTKSSRLLLARLETGEPLIVQDASQDPRFEKSPGAEVRGWMGVPLGVRGQIIGYITLDSYRAGAFDENAAALAQAYAHQAAIAIDNAQLFDNLQQTNLELSEAYDTTLEGWARALELRDKETLGHSRRVTDLTLRLARRLGVGESELTHIRRGVLLHDIGKMGVPDVLLKKNGPLTDQEWIEMRKHPQYAYELLHPITYLRPALDIPYSHHEKWDGSGYPRGLKGTHIPLAARIFAVADVYDALSYDRPYRAAWPRQNVLDYLREQSGAHFDPETVEAFLNLLQDNKSV
jgi:PAS domain S-box-containing protein